MPFKGGSAPVVALLGGQIDLFVSAPTAVLTYVKDRRLRAIAVSTAQRSPVLPDTPTISESGLRGFDVATWDRLLAPARTPSAIVEKLRGGVVATLETPEIRKRLLDEGAVPETSTPEGVRELHPHRDYAVGESREGIRRENRLIPIREYPSRRFTVSRKQEVMERRDCVRGGDEDVEGQLTRPQLHSVHHDQSAR